MPATRRKKTSAPSADTNPGQSADATTTRTSKRVADSSGDSQPTKRAKRAKKADRESSDEIKDEPQEASVKPEEPQAGKPRLTTPDLEFDYDRSQLRDPRPTPGRVKRPRKEDYEITEEWKQNFQIPKPVKPKGRLNAFQKDELFREASLLDPSAGFHDLYICHKKGPRGSPTYDAAGFALDWNKVDAWMKPKAYNKKAMVNGMERALARGKSEQEQMFDIFFVDGGKGFFDENNCDVKLYVKDQVSKDIGVPWHQIGVPELREWEKRGFEKKNAQEWWREPNGEERKRMLKMMSGASLRKDL